MSTQLPKRVKMSPEVLFRELDGEAVMLDLGTEKYYGLDKVGTRMWQLLEEHDDTEKVIAVLLTEYDVTEERLRQDLAELVENLTEAGLASVE